MQFREDFLFRVGKLFLVPIYLPKNLKLSSVYQRNFWSHPQETPYLLVINKIKTLIICSVLIAFCSFLYFSLLLMTAFVSVAQTIHTVSIFNMNTVLHIQWVSTCLRARTQPCWTNLFQVTLSQHPSLKRLSMRRQKAGKGRELPW